MQTMVTPAVPRVDLTRIHRKQTFTLSTPKTPRRAFISIQHDSSPVPEREQRHGLAPPVTANTITMTTAESGTRLELAKPPLLSFATDYKPGGKAKADDYDSEGKAIILRADAYYEGKIIGVQGFPKSGMKIAWAKKAFQDACRAAEKQYQSDKRVEQLIYSRGSRVRGDMLRHVEEAVMIVFGFSKDSSKKTQNHNLKLYNDLSKNMAFAFKDTTKLTGFAENSVFQLILRLVCFAHGDASRGIVFSRFFNPVSLETLALFMTQINHVMCQWSSGIYRRHGKSQAFTEVNNSVYHAEYLQELRNWEAVNTEVVLKIRKRMYLRAREKSGIDPPAIKAVITGDLKARMVSELAARTGETDTEDEKDDDMGSMQEGEGSDNGAVVPIDTATASD
ncbi:hypothetical protein DFH05DRAFT_1472795 [Lentinula detonsa]|uniref:DUF6532 domain-containing protein n=1 Tax=Lentinula detonsa TaxID=2804962 RepID=A0A9W8U0Z5_9AGAR|nr:hypothetical protein DFH05DRAFT_1472795 [Lentinula detonsa]